MSNLTDAPRDDIELLLSTLTAELDIVQRLTEGGGVNTVVGDFKSLTDVAIWVRSKRPSDTPKFEHFIDLGILLAGIFQTGLSRKEVRNKKYHPDRVKRSDKQSVVVAFFLRTPPEEWGSSN